MATIYDVGMPANGHVSQQSSARNAALDRTRTFLMLLVLLHHAVIPYTHFGHTDSKSWIGFDAIVLATDSFFMAMFFFLSGLFLWPSLAHNQLRIFFCRRLLRLGLPIVIAAFIVMPIAYYAISLRQTPEISFAVFWRKTITVGPWPSGPLWFIWVLLAFDLTASVLYRLSPSLVAPINRLSLRGHKNPAEFSVFMLVATAVLYIPARVYFGPNHWFELGPFSVQTSRVLLYACYFSMGAGVGAANFDCGLLGAESRLAKSGWGWVIASFVSYCLLWVLIYIKREILGNPAWLPNWYEVSYGFFFAAFSAAMLFANLAYFLKFKASGSSLLDLIQADAYGMFLVHYPIVLWIQYWLFDLEISAIAKALIAFVLTVALSWLATRALRNVPGAARVL